LEKDGAIEMLEYIIDCRLLIVYNIYHLWFMIF